MTGKRPSPSFRGLTPASRQASRVARKASKKRDTKCELVLRRALWSKGLRYRVCRPDLPGRPDIVFERERVLVFCDGDFWHGRDLEARIARLGKGHNSRYWQEKIKGNAARDVANTRHLKRLGWRVVRVWESEIRRNRDLVVATIIATLDKTIHE